MAERHTSTEQVELIIDPAEKARREAANGLEQTKLALEIIRSFVKDQERPFRMRQGLMLQLNAVALKDIHLLAGTYRNGPLEILASQRLPHSLGLLYEAVTAWLGFPANGSGRSWRTSSGPSSRARAAATEAATVWAVPPTVVAPRPILTSDEHDLTPSARVEVSDAPSTGFQREAAHHFGGARPARCDAAAARGA